MVVVMAVEPLRLLERDGTLEHGTLQVVGGDVEVAARLRLQVTIVHLHVDDSHEFNLSSELLNLFLEVGPEKKKQRFALFRTVLWALLCVPQMTFQSPSAATC